MSAFNVFESISYISINNENTNSGKWPTLIKTTLFPGHARVKVSANQSKAWHHAENTAKTTRRNGLFLYFHFINTCKKEPTTVKNDTHNFPLSVYSLLCNVIFPLVRFFFIQTCILHAAGFKFNFQEPRFFFKIFWCKIINFGWDMGTKRLIHYISVEK